MSAAREITWVGEGRTAGVPSFRVGRSGDAVFAEWPGLCTLRASGDGSDASIAPAADAPEWLLDKVKRSLVPALLRHLRGELTLHASAASIGGTAVAFFGPSGSGKSTAAAHAARRAGAALVADDTAAIRFDEDRIALLPTEAVSWLVPASARALGLAASRDTKIPITPPEAASSAIPLAAIVRLTFAEGGAPRLRRLHGHEALRELVPSVIRFVIDEPARHVRECEQLDRLVAQIPIWELERPRDLDQLGASLDALLAEVRVTGGHQRGRDAHTGGGARG